MLGPIACWVPRNQANERGHMKLYEPITATYFLITVLVLAFSSELFNVFLTKHERDCHQRNATLLQEQWEGPLQEC